MVEVRTIIGIGVLAGIGGAIWYFRDQISALLAPPSECPSGWVLDAKSGNCCPDGFTYDSATGKCTRTGTGETVTPSPSLVTEDKVLVTDQAGQTYFVPTRLAEIVKNQAVAPTLTQITTDPTKAYAWTAPETPVAPATPSVSYSPDAQPTGVKPLYNYYFRVEKLPSPAKPVARARIDIAGVEYQTVGILYTGADGIANFLKQVAGHYKYVVYVEGKKVSEGIAEFSEYEGQEMVIQYW